MRDLSPHGQRGEAVSGNNNNNNNNGVVLQFRALESRLGPWLQKSKTKQKNSALPTTATIRADFY